MAEGVGFEPTVRRTYNGFRDRPIRPLSHPSGEETRRRAPRRSSVIEARCPSRPASTGPPQVGSPAAAQQLGPPAGPYNPQAAAEAMLAALEVLRTADQLAGR